MARLILRLLGLCLLAVAIVVPGCQALVPGNATEVSRPDLMRSGQRP